MTLYAIRRTDGEPLGGDMFSCYTDDVPDGDDVAIAMIAQTEGEMDGATGPISFDIIKMTTMSRFLVYPDQMLCVDCHGEGVIEIEGDEPNPDCPRCDGSGDDPLEGKRIPVALPLVEIQ